MRGRIARVLTYALLTERAVPEPNTACLLWLRHVDRDGYGTVHYRGRKHRAHRVAWTLVKGGIPDGKMVCHHCDTPACINVDHLFLGDNSDNMRDRSRKGRNNCAKGWRVRRERRISQ